MPRGNFDTIPKELDEAAALDGLGPFGAFWRVILLARASPSPRSTPS